MRVLSDYEVQLVAGGQNGSDITVMAPTFDEIVVTAQYTWDWDRFNDAYLTFEDEIDYGDYLGGGGGGDQGSPPDAEPDCNKTDKVDRAAPDGAKYYVPESVSVDRLTDILNHLSDYSRSHSALALLSEFKAMYDNPQHPFFMDFKVFDPSAGTQTYYSEAAGRTITASVFEPFGNFWYGYAGTWAGISPDVLYGAAALVQQGSTGLIPRDAPEDQPHVSAGIAAAKAYAANPTDTSNQLRVQDGSCSTGYVSRSLNDTGILEAAGDQDRAIHDMQYRQGFRQYFETHYALA